MTEFERQRSEAENTMRAAARAQLGAPQVIEGEVVEDSSMEGEDLSADA